MSALLQGIFFFFSITFITGAAVLFVRVLRMQHTYLEQFPSVSGAALDDIDLIAAANPFSKENQSINRAMWQRQDDPELDRIRRKVWRHYGYLVAWMLGYPVLIAGLSAFLIIIIGAR